jgi:hypothetical protein
MAKKIFLIAILILGCSVYIFQNESKATISNNSASDSSNLNNSKSHKHLPPYRILNNRYVTRSTITKSIGHNYGVAIKLLQNGIDNTDIEDFSLAYNNGTEYRMGNVYGIENTTFPLFVKVTYKAWNTFHAVQFDVTYEFVIYYPGNWNVTIWN